MLVNSEETVVETSQSSNVLVAVSSAVAVLTVLGTLVLTGMVTPGI